MNNTPELRLLEVLKKTCRMVRVGGDLALAEVAARKERELTEEIDRLQTPPPAAPTAVEKEAA